MAAKDLCEALPRTSTTDGGVLAKTRFLTAVQRPGGRVRGTTGRAFYM